jgi:hypothetical protein
MSHPPPKPFGTLLTAEQLKKSLRGVDGNTPLIFFQDSKGNGYHGIVERNSFPEVMYVKIDSEDVFIENRHLNVKRQEEYSVLSEKNKKKWVTCFCVKKFLFQK